MGVDGIAAIMLLITLTNIFSGQKHLTGKKGHHWPGEETERP